MKTKKSYSTLFTFFSILMVFSQSTKKFDYEKYSNPNPKNQLSLYFKENVDRKLLKKAEFFSDDKNIILSFYINQQGEPYKLNVTSKGSEEYYNAIKNTFKDYFKKYIGYDSLNSRNKYSLQIISKKGSKKIFNCSATIIIEKPAICAECKDLDLYEDIKNCLNLEVKKHFYKNVNFNSLNNRVSENQVNLNNGKYLDLFFNKDAELILKFAVNKEGKLVNKDKEISSFFKTEINRVFNSFSFFIEPAALNNTFYAAKHRVKLEFTKDKKIIVKDNSKEFSAFSKPSISNDFSLYFKNNLTEEDLKKSNLSRINRILTITFEIDENENLFNITTNARSNFLDQKIKKLFKEYPIQKLTFVDKRKLNKHIIQILSFKDQKAIINASSLIGNIRPPILLGCETSKNITAAKNCFSRGVQMNFSRKFDADLPKRLGLTKGRKNIYIQFKINKQGQIIDINVKAPHIEIIKEVVSVMKKMPEIEPAYQNGQPIIAKYSIPFTIIVN